MINWIKTKKAVIIYLLILFIGIISLLGIGFAYSNSLIKYEWVQVGKSIPNLNYSLGTGDKNQATTSIIESPVDTTVNFTNIWAAENVLREENDYGYSDETRTSNQEKVINNLKIVLQEWELKDEEWILKDNNHFDNKIAFEDMQDTDQSMIILANSGEGKYQEKNLERAARIIFHYRPLEIENKDGNVVTTFPTLAYGMVDHIITNEDNTVYRLAIRDEAKWDWDNGDSVQATDIVMGVSHQIPASNGSAAAYMISDFSNLKGLDAAYESENVISKDAKERYEINGKEIKLSDYMSADGSITDKQGLEDAMIQYGLTKGSREIFKRDTNFQKAIGAGDVGVSYYDKDKKSEEEYSYVDFTLEQSSPSFPTMISSQAYWPVNPRWFATEIGLPNQSNMMGLGKTEDYIISNNAFSITRFDPIYGYDFKVNEHYWDKDLVPIQKGSYRFSSEASTKIAMFDNGTASQVDATGAADALGRNKEASKWIKPKFSKPQTGYMNWNLGPDRTTSAAKYISDPNFRRFIYHLFDSNTYHELAGYKNTQATSMYTAKGMFNDKNGADLIDYGQATNVIYDYQDTKLNSIEQKVENNGTLERKSALESQNNVEEDKNYNLELANYYWKIFVNDMKDLGVDFGDKNTITIKYLTMATGGEDPYQATLEKGIAKMQETYPLKDANEKAVEIVFSPINSTSSNFWTKYYSSDYDLSRAIWGPDYLDPWSFIGLFNAEDIGRHLNPTASWTMWDGSDYTFNESWYNNANKARELFNDGTKDLLKNKGNIKKLEFSKATEGISYEVDSINYENMITKLENAVNKDNPNADGYRANGLNHGAHTSDMWTKTEDKLAAWIVMEAILRDGSATMVGYNETASTNPSKLILESDPILGYETRAFAIDITKIKKENYWYGKASEELIKRLGK